MFAWQTEEASGTEAQRHLEQGVNDSPRSCFRPPTVRKQLTAPWGPGRHRQRFQTSTLPFPLFSLTLKRNTVELHHSLKAQGQRIACWTERITHFLMNRTPKTERKCKVGCVPLRLSTGSFSGKQIFLLIKEQLKSYDSNSLLFAWNFQIFPSMPLKNINTVLKYSTADYT